MEFKKLELDDINIVKPFFNYSNTKACDNSIGGAFIWRDLFKTEFAIRDNILFFKVEFLDKGTCFTVPLAENEDAVIKGIKMIKNYSDASGIKLQFCQVTDDTIELFSKLFVFDQEEMVSWADYLYRAEDIIKLEGRKYSKIRNRIHHFKKLYPNCKYEVIDDNNIDLVKKFFDKYAEKNKKDSITFVEDIEKTYEVLNNLSKYQLTGGCITVDGNQVVAFDFGEVINDVLYVHIEKADTDYDGSFQMIIWEYAKHNSKEGMHINREDSADDEGLTTAKNRWFPEKLVRKYLLEVKDVK